MTGFRAVCMLGYGMLLRFARLGLGLRVLRGLKGRCRAGLKVAGGL